MTSTGRVLGHSGSSVNILSLSDFTTTSRHLNSSTRIPLVVPWSCNDNTFPVFNFLFFSFGVSFTSASFRAVSFLDSCAGPSAVREGGIYVTACTVAPLASRTRGSFGA